MYPFLISRPDVPTTKPDTVFSPQRTIAYLAKVSDATTASASGLGWFKIFQDGLSGGQWAVDKFNANGGKRSLHSYYDGALG